MSKIDSAAYEVGGKRWPCYSCRKGAHECQCLSKESAMTQDTPTLIELKPCPFCGHAAKWVKCGNPREFRIECGFFGNCAGNSPTEYTGFTLKEDAIALWNRRHTPSRDVGDVREWLIEKFCFAGPQNCGETWIEFVDRLADAAIAAMGAETGGVE